MHLKIVVFGESGVIQLLLKQSCNFLRKFVFVVAPVDLPIVRLLYKENIIRKMGCILSRATREIFETCPNVKITLSAFGTTAGVAPSEVALCFLFLG
jgi:hypothetical protein